MKISVRNLEPTKVRLTVTVEPEEFNPFMETARKEIAKQINVPGFRKGHVPGKIIDQRIGYGAVAAEAANNGVPELYSRALEEKKIRPMAQPELDVKEVPQSAKDENKLKFVATVERRPDFTLASLDDMVVDVEKPEVTEEEVTERLERIRKGLATLVSVDKPAEKGNYVTINLSASIDDKVVDSQEGLSYEIGSGGMLDGLDEALEGLSEGEETTFEGTLESGDHAGEKALIRVKVNSVKAEELPDMDDELAKEASEFETLEELKEDIRKNLQEEFKGRQATLARDAFIALLHKDVEIPLPQGVKDSLIEEHLKRVTPDVEKATEEQKKLAEESASRELLDQMVLDQLAEDLDVSVTQEDVTNFLSSIAQQYGMEPQYFINSIVRNGQLGSAVQEVARSKGLLEGMRKVKFTSDGEDLDLSAFLGSDESLEEVEENESVEAASAAAALADELTLQAESDEEE